MFYCTEEARNRKQSNYLRMCCVQNPVDSSVLSLQLKAKISCDKIVGTNLVSFKPCETKHSNLVCDVRPVMGWSWRGKKKRHVAEYSTLKTGEYPPVIFPNLQKILHVGKNVWRNRECPQTSISERVFALTEGYCSCVFAPNGDYCLDIPSFFKLSTSCCLMEMILSAIPFTSTSHWGLSSGSVNTIPAIRAPWIGGFE